MNKDLAPLMMSRWQRGVSLIELMVSIVIGLLLVVVVVQLYLGSARTSQTQDAASRLDSNGRFALESIVRMVRMSGYRNWGGMQSTPPGYAGTGDFVVQGVDGAAVATNYSDTLTIRLAGSGTAIGVADGTVVDCLGNPLPEIATWADRFTNTFAVRSVGGSLELTCDIGGGPVTLVTGIASFQALYGVDTTGGDRAPDLWASATSVTAAGQWASVVAVKVSLLVEGDANSRGAEADSAVYRLFDVNYVPGPDLGTVFNAASQSADFRNRLHKIYTTTIFLRNRTFASEV